MNAVAIVRCTGDCAPESSGSEFPTGVTGPGEDELK